MKGLICHVDLRNCNNKQNEPEINSSQNDNAVLCKKYYVMSQSFHYVFRQHREQSCLNKSALFSLDKKVFPESISNLENI